MAGKIFISYRRDDAKAEARSIYQHLERAFGHERLFMDVDSIQKGLDFTKVLGKTLSETSVMLVVIGRTWLHQQDDTGRRRLDDPADYVRLEVVSALKRNIPVIPIRVDGTRQPRVEELPDDLKELVLRQGTVVTHENFDSDIRGLEQDIRALVEPGSSRRGQTWPMLAAGAFALALAVGLGAWLLAPKPGRNADTLVPAITSTDAERQKRETEARRRVDEELTRDARARADEARIAAEQEARRQAEDDARRRVALARAEAEAEAMRKSEADQRRQAEVARAEAVRLAAEARAKAEAAAEARKQEIAVAWEKARSDGTLAGYLAYLRGYRDANNRAEVKSLAAPLLRENVEAQIDVALANSNSPTGGVPLYHLHSDRPRAAAVCIDWRFSTSERLQIVARGMSGHATDTRLEPREQQAAATCQSFRREGANCNCEIVRRNQEMLTRIPEDWLARQLD